MAYENPKTLKEMLDGIRAQRYVLPAIQREFVWEPIQISRLFDSLMRGYPIGSFLFWRVDREHIDDFVYYGFVQHYHERDNPHCPRIDNLDPTQPVTAVLDGQQRLTALNIALRGSHAEKLPYKWKSNPDAYPAKQLYLNLLSDAPENEEGMIYDFRFLVPEKAEDGSTSADQVHWYDVRNVLEVTDGGPALSDSIRRELAEASNDGSVDADRLQHAYQRAYELWEMVQKEPVVHYYQETDQKVDRVLDIFIRTNSGGTELSYSDLLLSIATAQWTELSAREAVHGLVDTLNDTRSSGRFDFSKDFVLKAGLMLADISDVGFKVENFTQANMEVLEERWQEIQRALRHTVSLAASMGFNDKTLSAHSALLPIAYYVYKRGLTEGYLTRPSDQEDRDRIRNWLIRSLLKRGIWGAGLDTTLKAIRTIIAEHGSASFPVSEIEAEMRRRGKTLVFDADELDDLVEAKRDRRTFGLLALLYPFVELGNRFHIDHVFPRNAFYKPALQRLGFDDQQIDWLKDSMDQLPNLILLDGSENQSKQDDLPAAWLAGRYSSQADRDAFRDRHDLPELPEDLTGFAEFYVERRDRMRTRLEELLKDPNVDDRPQSPEVSGVEDLFDMGSP